MPVTRFAPSPTGYLHPGHAYSALLAAHEAGDGTFLLRIEDIDTIRCKPECTPAIFEDLRWLGLNWPEPVRCQSQHMDDYKKPLDQLREKGLLYPCFCSRREIEQEVSNAVHAPHVGGEGVIYPGTCRGLSKQERAEKMKTHGQANWRLDVGAALKITGTLFWHDRIKGRVEATPQIFGDAVLARKDIPVSYHLCVTHDDHLQGITLVTRGEDLFTSTHIHRLLQALLNYDVPDYFHHDLITDEKGQRYAKRDQSITLRALREKGVHPEKIRQLCLKNA